MKTWKKLSTKTLLTHKRHNVYEDEVELPGGHRTQYLHYGRHHNAATVIAINADGKVLIQQEYSYPPNKWLYHLPCGALEPDETPEAGALREFAEEAKLTGQLTYLGKYYMDNRRTADSMYVYLATELQPAEGELDAEEEIIPEWVTPKELAQMIADGKVTNHTLLAAWSLYLSQQGYPSH